jgi:hypothetical protein
MANLSGQTDIVADSITLVDGNQLVNIRDIFGAAQSSVPPTPAPTDVLNITGLTQLLGLKRDIATSYDQTTTDTLLDAKRDVSDSYSKQETYTTTEVGTLLAARRLISDSYSRQEVYTTTEVGILLAARRLISDSYSRSEIDAALQLKRDTSDSYSQQETYTTTEVGVLIGARRLISDSYSKTEVDNLVANAGGSGLTTAEQTWVTNGQTNLTQTATGITALNFDNFGSLKAATSTGTLQSFMRGRDNNDNTVIYYGSGGLRFENSSSEYAFSMFQDKTSVFNNHIYLNAADAELRIKGESASDACSVKFSTPSSGQSSYKSIIKAYGKNSSGKNQLAFLVSDSSSDVSANNNDATMIVDSLGVQIGNPTVGSTPGSSLDVRGGNIELSDFGSTALQHLKWSAFRTGGRHDIAKIVAQSTSTYGGNLILYYRAPNTNVATGANNIGIHISDSGNVGIGAASSSWKLAVPGSLYAVSMTAGTKPFLIKHPDPAKEGWQLKHTAIESDDQGSCLYRRQLECVQGKNQFDLPSWFSHLNEEVLVWANAFKHRGVAWGETIGNVLVVDASKAGVYNVLIFGKRKDPAAINNWKGAEIPPSEAVEIPEHQ